MARRMLSTALAATGEAARSSGKSKSRISRTTSSATAWPTTASQRRLFRVPSRTLPRAPRGTFRTMEELALRDARGVSLIDVIANLPGRQNRPGGLYQFPAARKPDVNAKKQKRPRNESGGALQAKRLSPGRARLSRLPV